MAYRDEHPGTVSVDHVAAGEPLEVGAATRGITPDGSIPVDLQPGDFVLTHGDAWTSKFIRFGQRLRYRGQNAKYAYWNHAAIVVDDKGSIVEALGSGVKKTHISDYEPKQRTLVRIRASEPDRDQACLFAERAVGSKYAIFTIISIGYSLLTGGKFSFGFQGQHICSGLVARALERTGLIFEREPSHMMPADLAMLYDVEPPPPGTPKNTSRR